MLLMSLGPRIRGHNSYKTIKHNSTSIGKDRLFCRTQLILPIFWLNLDCEFHEWNLIEFVVDSTLQFTCEMCDIVIRSISLLQIGYHCSIAFARFLFSYTKRSDWLFTYHLITTCTTTMTYKLVFLWVNIIVWMETSRNETCLLQSTWTTVASFIKTFCTPRISWSICYL